VTASFADNEIWHVMIADDMKRMNVDQLDDAFRLSLVDTSTMVWKAGMKTWQRLGAVAGIEDEPAPVTHRAPPPPPRPMARPTPKPPSPSRVPASFHTAGTPIFPAPTLLAPVYAPTLQAPDPFVLPKRRVAIPSEIDFRRSSSGVRWGRWLIAVLLLTGGVLAAYRQNLLREGARRLGLENKYLHSEERVTAYLNARAPGPVKLALTRLALLPGPNAAAIKMPGAAAPLVVAPASETKPLTSPEPVKATEPAKPAEPEVKTVSLDSLPVLTADEASKPATAAVAPAPRAHVTARAEPQPASVSRREAPAKVEKAVAPKPVAAEKPALAEKPEPKPKAAPPPPANDNPLKAAIRQAIAADNAKK
jgi:hypothetical protein